MARDPSGGSRRRNEQIRRGRTLESRGPGSADRSTPQSAVYRTDGSTRRIGSYRTDDSPWRNGTSRPATTERIPLPTDKGSGPKGSASDRGKAPGNGAGTSGGGKNPRLGPLYTLFKWVSRVPKPVIWSVVGVFALIVLTMVLDAAIYYNKVHAGVSIQGQSVSGLTRDEAIQKVQQVVTESQSGPITLTRDGKTWHVERTDLGASMDVEGAVTAALDVTRQRNFVVDMATKLRLYFGSEDVPLEGSVDFALLDDVIVDIARELDNPAVDAGVAVRGTEVTNIEGREGLVVDQETLRQLLTDTALSLDPSDIEIPMIVDEPNIIVADNQTALEQARTMVSAPVTLAWGEKSWTFTPEEISSFIDFTNSDDGDSSTVEPYLSAQKMAAKLREIGAETTVAEPVDAYFVANGDKATLMPAVEGVTLDAEKTAENLTEAALKPTGRLAEVAGEKQEPELTTAEAEAMGITELLGTEHIYLNPNDAIERINARMLKSTSTYRDIYTMGGTNREHNVRLVFKYATKDGALYLAPGEEFNFLETVGPRTAERGFVKAYGIEPGLELTPVYGGGICEISTAFFNAALFCGLEVTERRNHTIFFDHYPYGQDATVTDNGPNLRFVNNTGHHIWITGSSDGRETVINVYGTDDGRKVTLDVSNWYGVHGPYTQTTEDPNLPTGVSIEITPGVKAKMLMVNRTVTWPDGRTVKDNFESNYKHKYRIVKVGTGTTTTTKYMPPTSTTTATTP